MINEYGQDIDVMYESDCDREWEELNDEDCQTWYTAISKLNEAVEAMNKAESKLHLAAGYVLDTPEESRIESLADSMAELADFVQKQIERMR